MKKMLPTYSCIRIFSFKTPWSLLKLQRNFPRECHTIIPVHLWIKIWSNDKCALIVAYTFRPLKRNHFTGVVAEPLKVVLKTQQSVCDHRETIIYYFIYSGVRKVFPKIIQQKYFKETWFVLRYRSVSCQEIIVMCYKIFKYNKLRHFAKYFGESFSMQNNSKSFQPHKNGVLMLIIILSL